MLLFVIQIPSAERFAVARDIDPAYAAAFDRARAAGVEMLAWRCAITVDGIEIAAPVPIDVAAASGLLALAARMLTLRANIHGHFLRPHAMTYVDAACAPLRKTGQIKIHGADAFEGMRKAGRLAAECLDMLVREIKPGVSTERIDRLVYEFGMDHGALPATLMYRGYRKSTCTSVNHVVCHGIPGDKPLREGDIVNVDVTLILDGWHGDSSRMYAVGEIPRRAERLIEVTYEGMMRGIAAIKPGGTTGDIGHAIQTYVEAQHMSVVRDFCGHGLGRLFHDEPNIVHVGRPGEGIVLKPGMFFTVEPMINLGRAAREGAVRRLDRGDPRPLAVGAVRALGRRDRDRRRDFHAVAEGPRQAALSGLSQTARPPQGDCKIIQSSHPYRYRPRRQRTRQGFGCA